MWGFSLVCVCAMVTVAGNGLSVRENWRGCWLIYCACEGRGVSRAFENDCADILSIMWCLLTFANQSTETWRGWEVQWLQYLLIK